MLPQKTNGILASKQDNCLSLELSVQNSRCPPKKLLYLIIKLSYSRFFPLALECHETCVIREIVTKISRITKMSCMHTRSE